MKIRLILLLLIAAIVSGCGKSTPIATPAPYTGYKDEMDEYLKNQQQEKASASLFARTRGDKLFIGSRSKVLGDIIVVKIVEKSNASNSNKTSTNKSTTYDSSISAMMGLPTDFGMEDFLGSGNSFSPTIGAKTNNKFSGDGSKTKKDSVTATIAARVIEILPNGNVVIEGNREIIVDQEKQVITLRGIVREKDIAPDNTISSTSIADARITYSGDGMISDANKKGWLATFFDWIWPF